MIKQLLNLLLLCAVSLVLSSCAKSPNAKFYSLNAIPRTGLIELPARKVRIKIGPVTLPENLQQTRIVTRQGPNRIKPAEFHRWAGDLQNDIQNVLAENISILLPTDQVSLYQDLESKPGGGYQIIIHIRDFSGKLGGMLQLNADWRLISLKDPSFIISEKTILQQQTAGPGYQAYVAAQSRLLEKLSVIISYALKEQIRIKPS